MHKSNCLIFVLRQHLYLTLQSLQDIRNLVIEHKDDCPDAAVTGKYILRWSENDNVDSVFKRARKLKEGVSTPAGPMSEGHILPVKAKPGRKPKLNDGSVQAKAPKKPSAGSRYSSILANYFSQHITFWNQDRNLEWPLPRYPLDYALASFLL